MLFWSDSKCLPVPTLAELLRQMETCVPLDVSFPPTANVHASMLSDQEIESQRRSEMLRIAKENKETYQMYCELCEFAGIDRSE